MNWRAAEKEPVVPQQAVLPSPFSSSLQAGGKYRPLSPVASTWVQKQKAISTFPGVLHLQPWLPLGASTASPDCTLPSEGSRIRGCRPGGNLEGSWKEAGRGEQKYRGPLDTTGCWPLPCRADAGLGWGREGDRRKMKETGYGPHVCAGEERTQQRVLSHSAERTPNTAHTPSTGAPGTEAAGPEDVTGEPWAAGWERSRQLQPKVMADTATWTLRRHFHLISTKSRRNNGGGQGQLDEMRTFQTELKRSKLKHRQQGEKGWRSAGSQVGWREGALLKYPPAHSFDPKSPGSASPLLCPLCDTDWAQVQSLRIRENSTLSLASSLVVKKMLMP